MESRPEHRVVRRLMWEAAALGGAADEPERGSPATAPKADPLEPAHDSKATPDGARPRALPSGRGPGSQIRRYVHLPQVPASKKPGAPTSPEPIKPRD